MKNTGEVTFEPKPKDVKERVKTFDDVLTELGVNPQDFYNKTYQLAPDTKAYEQIKLITKALNEGWAPDWTDGKPKYYAYFEMGSPSGSGFRCNGYDYWPSRSDAGSRLCFKSAELATYAGKQFEEIYKQFLTLNQ